MQLHTSNDVTHDALAGQTIAIVGYGSQGRAHALNLADSGYRVIVGARQNGGSWFKAQKDGLEAMTPEDAAEQADLVALLTPDMCQPEVYQSIKDRLRPKSTLLFAHGFNIHSVSYTHLRAHETSLHLVCRLLLEKKKKSA